MSFLDDARTRELWEKVKTGLSGKQPKLTGSAGQVVGFGADGAAVAVSGWSNPNLLDNWYFQDPVNQRGQEEYPATGYTIDRWVMSLNGKLSLVEGGVLLEQTSSANLSFVQRFEDTSLLGKQVTISYLVDVSGIKGDFAITGLNKNYTNQFVYKRYSAGMTGIQLLSGSAVLQENNCYGVGIYVYSAAELNSIKLVAAKLELGSQQTLAHQDAAGNWVLNDPPPNKALELAKCQRYQIAINIPGRNYEPIGTGVAYSSSRASIIVPLPVSLRSRSTVVHSGDFFLLGLNEGNSIVTHAVTNLVIDEISNNSAILDVTVNDTLVLGSSYNLQADIKFDNKLLLDANL